MSELERDREVVCPSGPDWVAWLQGEIDHTDTAGQLARHASACRSCAEQIDGLRAVIGLCERDATRRAAACVDVGDASSVVARVLARERRQGVRRVGALVAALVPVVVLLALALRGRLQEEAVETATRAASAPTSASAFAVDSEQHGGFRNGALLEATGWLLSTQAADGSWSPAEWGGRREYRAGVTALAVLALESADIALVGRDRGAEAREAALRGAEWLARAQTEAASFGDGGRGALYNDSIGALALLEVSSRVGRADLVAAARRAVDRLVAAQRPSGAWGYLADEESLSISIWPIQCLTRARELGHAGLNDALARGLEWLAHDLGAGSGAARSIGHDGHVCGGAGGSLGALGLALRDVLRGPTVEGRRALDEIARRGVDGDTSVDLYGSYFLCRLLSRADAGWQVRLRDEAWRSIASRQERSGRLRGSWAPDDRWSPTGGRLCSTALAALALSAGPGAGS